MSRVPISPASSRHPFHRRIMGIWSLVDYRTQGPGSQPPRFPLGTNPRGLLMYHPEGFMAAHIMKPPESPSHSRTGILKLHPDSDSDLIGASHRFSAYAGGYRVAGN
ncbi:hypothetical protein BO78DRAFT_420548 [Aspergillus sclerotiicarbonarius CBS 121057]|uniref:Lipocalin-like domain-containing protein n=1 Tax=Aspergillus sclerotiicarbonarius (strain CBS 121057 / IBT 28362) TaxID=1448318 RepID=A0A319E3L8_ASPSB|nr:hypothetical protein BO78DRAFT_420548 [Aspergillus sclerotiicarbonarius CBS 121057]